ncbi:MAG: ATP-binding protein [Actinomycetota bacterium]|nr:ATP-binding protein [Actinomycetota bacterium]
MRRTLVAWLTERGVAAEHREDLVLAVNEAVTNVIDHAYRGSDKPGFVEIDVELSDEHDGECWVTVVVTDYGAWRQGRAAVGFRGRGLQMIRACTDWRVIERLAVGTRVTMARRVG